MGLAAGNTMQRLLYHGLLEYPAKALTILSRRIVACTCGFIDMMRKSRDKRFNSVVFCIAFWLLGHTPDQT